MKRRGVLKLYENGRVEFRWIGGRLTVEPGCPFECQWAPREWVPGQLVGEGRGSMWVSSDNTGRGRTLASGLPARLEVPEDGALRLRQLPLVGIGTL